MTEHRFPGKLDWINGKVLVVEVPDIRHEAPKGVLCQMMHRVLGSHVISLGSTSTLDIFPSIIFFLESEIFQYSISIQHPKLEGDRG